MELSRSDLIRALVGAYRSHTQVRPHHAPQNAARPASRGRKIRCKSGYCGECVQCLENARWERIFAEKFADPNYYTCRITRNASPLSAF
jgi:hypothetical protein